MACARLVQRVVRHHGHRQTFGQAIGIEAQQFSGAERRTHNAEVRAVEAGRLHRVGHSQIDLVAEDDSGKEVASAGARMLRRREDRHQHVARVPAGAAGPVVDVVHLDVAGCRPVHEGRKVGRCPQIGADHAGAARVRHLGRDLARDAARFSRKSADQCAERVDYPNFRRVNGLLVEPLIG